MAPTIRKTKASQPKASSSAKKVIGTIHKKEECEIDRFANTPQALCHSCQQKTSTIDRNSPKGRKKFLYWLKTRKVKKFKKNIAAGNECAPCNLARLSHFGGMKQDDLVSQRAASTKVDEKFWELREDYVSGDRKHKGEKVDVVALLESGNKDFYKRSVGGLFDPIEEFAIDRKIEF